jgi:glutaredoxin
MTKPILFSLENCVKCMETKELLTGRDDIEIVTFPHDLNQWGEQDLMLAKSHDVFEDLQKTAPVLWLEGEKKIGYLRIRKWIQDTTK